MSTAVVVSDEEDFQALAFGVELFFAVLKEADTRPTVLTLSNSFAHLVAMRDRLHQTMSWHDRAHYPIRIENCHLMDFAYELQISVSKVLLATA
jgi:hypothetical protein